MIQLAPLGRADRRQVELLRGPLERAFAVPTAVREFPVDLRRFYDPARVQYNSTELILHLRGLVGAAGPGAAASPKVLAVLEEDLFIPILTFVFGEAELGGSVAVMSYHRLQNELYGLPPDRDLLAARTAKEALHELGHAYGLVHCPDIDCVMHTSTDVEAVDLKGTDFCSTCRGTLHTLRNGGRP